MSRRPKAKHEHEFVVIIRATYEGCIAYVNAASLAEAREKANRGEFSFSVDARGADLVDWECTGVQINE